MLPPCAPCPLPPVLGKPPTPLSGDNRPLVRRFERTRKRRSRRGRMNLGNACLGQEKKRVGACEGLLIARHYLSSF